MSEGEKYIPEEATEPEEADEVSREEQAARLINFLDKIHAEQIFDSRDHKMDFVQNLTYEDYTNLLLHINGIVRDIPSKERKLFQPVHMAVPPGGWGELAMLTPSDMPPIEAKPGLLKYGFNRAKELEDPRLIGLVAAATINAVHIFADGNGRTSRLTYDLLNYNYKGTEKDKKFLQAALGEEGRTMTPDVNPSMQLYGAVISLIIKEGFTKFGDADYYFYNPRITRKLEERNDLSEEEKRMLSFVCSKDDNDRLAAFLAISRVLKRDDRLNDFVSHFVKKEEGINSSPLDSRLIADKATSKDIEGFYNEYWKVKSVMVSEMIDQLVENRNLPNTPPLNGLPAQEFEKNEISYNLARNKERWKDLADVWPEFPEETT